MALVSTTLSSACGVSDTTIVVASATNIAAPNFTSGSTVSSPGAGVTYLSLETEVMLVLGVNGTFISVQRGYAGTPTSAHASSCPVISGLASDFGPFVPAIKANQDPTPNGQMYGFSAPVASSATIAASGALFHVTGGTAINIITPPAGMIEGTVTIVFDSVCTWTSSNTTNGISASGTCTTSGSAVQFFLDGATSRWYPARLA